MAKKNIKVVNMCLQIKYDADFCDHPSDWNWSDLINCGRDESVEIVDCEDIEMDSDTGPDTLEEKRGDK